MAVDGGILFFVHGANVSPAILSRRVAWLRAGLDQHGLEDVRLVAPPWRENSGMVLGPVDLTLPTDGEASRALDLAVNLEARLAAFNPFTIGIQGLIWRAFTNYFDDRRPELMRLVGNQLLGDSLAYQLYRPRILDYICEELTALGPGPIVTLGESLGGVILLELLSEGRVPEAEVAGMISVGSQAPILYALGALEALPLDGERPPFGPWWNVYDPRDFLSFLAAPIFSRYGRRIEDVRVESGHPFPESHGSYFELGGTWQVIRTAFGR